MTPSERQLYDSIFLPDGTCGGRERLVPKSDSKAATPELAMKYSGSSGRKWKGGVTIGTGGYWLIFVPQHQKATKAGYVREHILIVERALGAFLPAGAIVHHVNGNKLDNRPENLVLCQDEAFHQILHRRDRALAACGNADALYCPVCKKFDLPVNMWVLVRRKGNKRHTVAHHRKCHAEREKQRKAKLRHEINTCVG